MSKLTVNIIPDASSNSLGFSSNYRIFSNSAPIYDAMRVLVISDTVDIGSGVMSNLKRYFRYSTDKTNWSFWYEFVPDGSPAQGMDVIETVQMNPDVGTYIEYKYEYDDGTYNPLSTPIVVSLIKTRLETRDTSATIDTETTSVSSCSSEFCPALVFDRDATFNPYDVGNFVNLYAETSMYVNRTFGLPVLYFRTEPASGGGDFIFKEWNLFNVVERKCIKVVVPNNDFPDSKLHYNEFGIDYEVPFEVHIDKRYFEMMFNPASEVRKKDFLYFPMLNRMFEIQGSYMFRGLMMAPLYWKAQLVKFKPNINYLMNAETTKFLDNLLLDTEETLSKVANGDIKDATMPDQYKTISSRFDETRSELNAALTVRQERYYFNYATLIDYYYDLSQGLSADTAAVKYNKTGVFNDTMPNLTYTWMFNVRTTGIPFTIIKSKGIGSPDPNTGIEITGVVNGTTLTMTVKINGNTVLTTQFANISTGRWYAGILQLSQEFKQYGIFIYDPIEDQADTLNHNEFKLKNKSIGVLGDVSFDTGVGYELISGPLYIANLRVFNVIIKPEDHQYVLSQLFVKDESLLHVIDNCRPQLNVPVVAKVR